MIETQNPVELRHCDECGHETLHNEQDGYCIGCESRVVTKDGSEYWVSPEGEEYPMPRIGELDSVPADEFYDDRH